MSPRSSIRARAPGGLAASSLLVALLAGACGSDTGPGDAGTTTTCVTLDDAANEGASNTTLVGDRAPAAPKGGQPAAEASDGDPRSNSAGGDAPDPALGDPSAAAETENVC
jgi:hypothetical protein